MLYKKVSIEEELPPMNEFVTCFYDSGETMVYRRISIPNSDNQDWFWIMRDGITDRTLKESKITHWLKEIEDIPVPIEVISLNEGNPEILILVNGCTIRIFKEVVKEMIGQYIYPTKPN